MGAGAVGKFAGGLLCCKAGEGDKPFTALCALHTIPENQARDHVGLNLCFPNGMAMELLKQALPNIRAWTLFFVRSDIPVFKRTAAAIARLREDEDNVSPRDITFEVLQDPLMTLKVLAYVGTHKRRQQVGDIETVEASLLMMGISTFFNAFSNSPTVEDRLKDHPDALLGLMRVIARAKRASEYAADWAGYRNDLDIAIVAEAAMLHDMAEMLIYCAAPELAKRMQIVRQGAPTMRSREIQKMVLGVELNQLEVALMHAWRLPTLLQRLTDDAHAEHPQVRNVLYAVNLTRHSANGWDDPALPDDYKDIAALLNVTPEWVQEHVC